jgi:hypothetical protein
MASPTLPKPTNKQSRLLRMCNRLALAPVRTCRSLHSCTFCGLDIKPGETYRDKGYGARAHDFCFKAVAREYNVAQPCKHDYRDGGDICSKCDALRPMKRGGTL